MSITSSTTSSSSSYRGNRGRGGSRGDRGRGRGGSGSPYRGRGGSRGGGRGRGGGSSTTTSSSGSEIRAFIAIPLPKHIVDQITNYAGILDQQVQSSKQQNNFVYRWVKPEMFHITVKFLGDQKPETLEDLHKELQNTLRSVKSFKLKIGHASETEKDKHNMIGVFPNTKNPRVVFVHAEVPNNPEATTTFYGSNSEKLDDARILYNKVMDAVHSASVPYEDKKDFSMHITVARVEEKNKGGGYRGGRGGMSYASASAPVTPSVNYTELHSEWESTVNTPVQLTGTIDFDVDRVVILQSVGGKYVELHEVKLA